MTFKNTISSLVRSFVVASIVFIGNLHSGLSQQPQTQTAPLYATNAKYTNGVAPGYAPTYGSGLTLNLGGGTTFCSGQIAQYAANTLTMTPSTTNYVYLNSSASCVPAVKTTSFGTSDIPIAIVTTNSSSITNIVDVRTPFNYNPSGGSGLPAATAPPQLPVLETQNSSTPTLVRLTPDIIPDATQTMSARGGISSRYGVDCGGDSNWTDPGHGLPTGFGACHSIYTSAGATSQASNGGGGYALTGSSGCDFSFLQLAWRSTLVGASGNPSFWAGIGTNNANPATGGSSNTTAPYLQAYQQCVEAAILTVATSNVDKFFVSNTATWAQNGSWTAFNPFIYSGVYAAGSGYSNGDSLTIGVSQGCVGTTGTWATGGSVSITTPGYGCPANIPLTTTGGTGSGLEMVFTISNPILQALETTANNASLTATLQVPVNGAVAIEWGALPSSYGTPASFELLVDGTPAVGKITQSSTLSAAVVGTGRIDTGGWPMIVNAEVFTGIAQGSHVFTFQTTSAGLFIPIALYVISDANSSGTDGPNITLFGVPPEQNNANALQSYTYDQQNLAAIQLAQSIGLDNARYVSPDWTTSSPGSPTVPVSLNIDSTLDMLSGTATAITACAASGTTGTFTATNTLSVGAQGYIYGFTTTNCSQLNGQRVTITSRTGSQFVATLTSSFTIATTTDSGNEVPIVQGRIVNTVGGLHFDNIGAQKVADLMTRAAKMQQGVSGSSYTVTTPPTASTTSPGAFAYAPLSGILGTATCPTNAVGAAFVYCQQTQQADIWDQDFNSSLVSYLTYNGALHVATLTTGNNASLIAGQLNLQGTTGTSLLAHPSATANAEIQFECNGGQGGVGWQNSSGTQEWTLYSNLCYAPLTLTDSANTVVRAAFTQGGVTNINSGGTSAVQFNVGTGLGTGGIAGGNGTSATPTWSITGSGALTVTSCSGCGSGGSGTVNSGTANQLAYYSTTGTAVSGDPAITDNGTLVLVTEPVIDENIDNVLYAANFPGADMSVQLTNCLLALYAISTESGECKFYATSSTVQTLSQNFFAAAGTPGVNFPVTGLIFLCGFGSIKQQVPIVAANNWRVVGCGNSQGAGAGSQMFTADPATFPAAVVSVSGSNGSISSTPATGQNSTWTGTGTSWASNLKGCLIVAQAAMLATENVTTSTSSFGVIHAVNSATSLTIGWSQNNGGAPAGSDYAITCGQYVAGDGDLSGSPYTYSGPIENLGFDCNSILGCVGIMNLFSEEGFGANNIRLQNYCIGIEDESNYSQNSGPYNHITMFANSSTCGANAIDYVSRGSSVNKKGLQNSTLAINGSTPLTVAVDEETLGDHLSQLHIENATTAVQIGAIQPCPIVCALPPRTAQNAVLDGINVATSGTTVVALSNAYSTPLGVQVRNVTINAGSSWTNTLTDTFNNCTDTATRVGVYELSESGGIQNSTSTTQGCYAAPALSSTTITPSGTATSTTAVSSHYLYIEGQYGNGTGTAFDQAIMHMNDSASGTNVASYFEFNHSGSPNFVGWQFDQAIIGQSTVKGTQFTSTIATGTPPFVVSSTTQVANLAAATAAALNSASALPNGTTATTQSAGDTSNDVATDNYVATAVAAATAGSREFSGYCSGAATASTTLSIIGLGSQNNGCTGTPSAGLGLVMPSNGTLSNLTVRCTTTGVATNSGVFTLYDIPSGSTTATATALTVTYGNGSVTLSNTSIYDNTHTYAYSKGDVIQLKFTTQASETLSGCMVGFNY